MILRSIEVEGWKCFAEAAAVGPFDERLNVLHGPNGAGKSTLVWAMIRGLLDSHKAGGKAAEMLRPRGKQLSPRVMVEFSHGGVDYRIWKRFLERATTLLEKREAESFVRIAEGDAAVFQVREMLRGESPASGLSSSRHWGVAAALWSPQGGLAIEGLTGNALEDIRASLGGQLSGAKGREIEQRVLEKFGEFYTPTGKRKSGKDAPRLVKLEADLAALDLETKDLRARDHLNRERRQELLKAEQQVAGLEQRVSSLREEVQAARKTALQFSELKAAESEYKTRKDQFDRIETGAVRMEKLREASAKLEELMMASQDRITIKVPKPSDISTVEGWVKRRDEAQIRLEASLVRLELRPASPQAVRVVHGESKGEYIATGDGVVEVEVEGFGSIVASGPAGSADEHRRNIEHANRELAKYETDNVALMRETLAEAQRLEAAKREHQAKAEQLATLEADLQALLADGKDHAARSRELDESAIKAHALRAAIGHFTGDPIALAQRLELDLQRAESESRHLREQMIETRALLRQAMEEAPYQKLVEKEEAAQTVKLDVEAEQLRADALKLLFETVQEAKQEALAGLTEPVAEEATALLARIAGPALGRVRISESLAPSGFEDLSGGETEQLYLATRLALGAQITRDERRLVVLDDVLTATDDRRLERIFDLMRERADRIQFLILTCHPERYKSLREARFIDIEALRKC